MKQVHILIVGKNRFQLYEAMSRMSFGMWVDVRGRVINNVEEAKLLFGFRFDAVVYTDEPSDEVRGYLSQLISHPKYF